jgi:hypothetical protein
MPNANEVKGDYVNGATGASDKLVRKYVARTDKLARASSNDAQANFEAAMKDPKVLKRRQNNLRKLSEEDLNRSMQAKGGSAYSAGVMNAGEKWANNVQPYFSELVTITKSLPPRTRDPKTNVMNRVAPIAVGLRAKKESMG